VILAMESPERPLAKPPGRLSKGLLRLLMKRATVVAVERLTDRFRLITLEGSALEGIAWTPGQKIQIAMGSAFSTRTYTPIEWDAANGQIRILGYAHGDGPGSAWVRRVEPGDECDIFGPRASVDVRHAIGSLAVFGDETSIGVAYALARQDRSRSFACYFETGDMVSVEQVVAQLGISNATLFARRGDDAQFEEMEATLPALAATGVSFVLTGKAGTIQRLRQSLKLQAVPTRRIVTKAYWAPGKAGLD
jgi:NADPH-dependent ferric siderophore reductase